MACNPGFHATKTNTHTAVAPSTALMRGTHEAAP
jgi:hypothetical protein